MKGTIFGSKMAKIVQAYIILLGLFKPFGWPVGQNSQGSRFYHKKLSDESHLSPSKEVEILILGVVGD